MSITTGSVVLWSDAQAIYNSINTQRARWSLAKVTVPSNPGTTMASQVNTMKQAIEDLRSTSAGTIANTGVSVGVGDLIIPDAFNRMNTTLANLAAANVSFHASFHTSFHASFRSSFFTSNNGFGSCSFSPCSCDGFYSRSDYRGGFGGSRDGF